MSIGPVGSARFMMVKFDMRPKDDRDEPSATRGPLADFVDDKLNKPLAQQIAEELEEGRGGPARSGATDYAHGTAEHEDDRET
jgi:hypothetical protein